MTLLRKINLISVGIILMLNYSSCVKDAVIPNETEENPEELQRILDLGFNKNKIENFENYYLVEGCYVFLKEDFKEAKDLSAKNEKNRGRKSQVFRNFGTKVSLSNSNIRIFVNSTIPTSGVDNWRSALNAAVSEYNSLSNLYLTLQVVSSASLADIIIQSDDSLIPKLKNEVFASAQYPAGDGKPGRNLYINLDNGDNQTISEEAKKHILVHELGHNLGLAHTDETITSPLQQIPGTPSPSTGDANSVMNSKYSIWNGWLGFSHYDIAALQYVYGKKINISIDGPRKASNIGSYTWTVNASGGTAPYSYKWYRKYDVLPWSGTISTNKSYVGNMPLDSSLELKVVVSDANGISDSTNIRVMNTGSGTKPDPI